MTAKKTIIIVHPHFTSPGGAGKVVLEIGSRLAKTHAVYCLAQKIDKTYISQYPKIKFISLAGPTTDSFKFWLFFPYWQIKTWQKIRRFSSVNTTVLTSVFPSNWLVFPYKLFCKNTKITWFCQEPSAFVQDKKWISAISNPLKKTIAIFLNPIFKIIDNYFAQIPDTIFANSKYSQKIIKKTYKRQSVVVYPGVDTKKFKPVPFSEKENYILTVGHLSKFKRIDILIKALAKIKNKNYRLKIVGRGEELQNLKNLAKKLKISNKVDFLTNIADQQLPLIYAKTKLFILCSKDEPFGIAPVEAMACGTPVIADNSGGPMETVIDDVTGKIINITSENLKLTLSEASIHNDLIKKWSVNARKQALKFDWTQSINNLTKYF